MTNDAPNRVVLHLDNPKLDNGWEGWWHACEGANGPGIGWYIYEDQAQAELQAAVAAEREACAELGFNGHVCRRCNAVFTTQEGAATDCCSNPDWDTPSHYQLAEAIRARTDPNAQTALEAVKNEARNEALREAVERVRKFGTGGAYKASIKKPDGSAAKRVSGDDAVSHGEWIADCAAKDIEALTKENKDDQ